MAQFENLARSHTLDVLRYAFGRVQYSAPFLRCLDLTEVEVRK